MDKYSKNIKNLNNLFMLPDIDIRMSNIKQIGKHSLLTLNHGGSMDPNINLNNKLAPVNKPRFIQDAILWRDAIRLAEQAVLPFRYLMQLQYMDTVLDNHIRACLKRREGLQLNRKFSIKDANGVKDEKWTNYFTKTWFKTFMKYTLEAKWYGYTLISMGDIDVDGNFKSGDGGIVMIPRTHISPDRLCVAMVPEAPSGDYFLEEPYCYSHIWISTPDEHGLAACGYGQLYEVTLVAISLRNNLFYNEQFLEVFGMPFRWVTTDRLDKGNQERIESMMEMMGSLGYGILGPNEKLEFIDTGKGGAYKGYGDFETRLEKKVSQSLLGHSDAMSSTPGKLGSQTGELSPQQDALNNIQAEDGDFICEQINGKLFNFIRKRGINIPNDLYFSFDNDLEEKENQKWKNEQNKFVTESLLNVANAIDVASMSGYEFTPEFIENLTGFKVEKVKGFKEKNVETKEVKKVVNAVRTDSPEYIKMKQKREKYEEKLDAKKKPSIISDEEWKEYKKDLIKYRIDEEYRLLTGGFVDDNGLDKEEYKEYIEDIQEKIENDIPIREDDGDCQIHINCRCSIENGKWLFNGSEEPDELVCFDCISAAEDVNNATDKSIDNILNILNFHKGNHK